MRTPALEEEVAIIFDDDQQFETTGGRIAATPNPTLVMIIWPDSPIEDYVETSSLLWNSAKNRWEMSPEG